MTTEEVIDQVRAELFPNTRRPESPHLQTGQLWESSTGNRWAIVALTLGHNEGTGKVSVLRVPEPGKRLPKWEDGRYVFPPEVFQSMRLIEQQYCFDSETAPS